MSGKLSGKLSVRIEEVKGLINKTAKAYAVLALGKSEVRTRNHEVKFNFNTLSWQNNHSVQDQQRELLLSIKSNLLVVVLVSGSLCTILKLTHTHLTRSHRPLPTYLLCNSRRLNPSSLKSSLLTQTTRQWTRPLSLSRFGIPRVCLISPTYI